MEKTYLVSTVIFIVVFGGFLVICGLYSSPYQHLTVNAVMVNKTETYAASYTNEMALQREMVYKRRSDHLTEVCKSKFLPDGKISERTLKHDILLHLDHQVCYFKNILKMILSDVFLFFKLAYCPIGKAGTSTWMQYFFDLTNLPAVFKKKWNRKGHTKMRILYNLPEKLSYDEKILLLRSSLKVTFVRHPFVRLVSTYQDKVVDHDHRKLYKSWRKESLRFPSSQRIVENIPNFDQFVEFLLSMDHIATRDPHVDFYWRKCDLCHMHYDVLGKLETFTEDLSYIFYKVSSHH